MSRNLSFWRYTIGFILSFAILIILSQIISAPNTLWEGLIKMSVVCFFPIWLLSFYVLKDSRTTKIVIIAYFVKIIIGLIHFLIFVEPEYFNHKGDISTTGLHEEFVSVYTTVDNIIFLKNKLGLFHISTILETGLPHSELWSIISIPLVNLKNFVLNILPINVYSSLVTAINIIVIAKDRNIGDNPKNMRLLILIAIWFPMFLLCDMYYRDAVGIALMSVGITMISKSSNILQYVLSFAVAIIFSYMLRTVYPVAIFGAFAIWKYVQSNNKIWGIIFLCLCVIGILVSYAEAMAYHGADYSSHYVKSYPLYLFPIKIVLGLIGPFPWTQFFDNLNNKALAFQLADYILGTLQFSILIICIMHWRKIFFISTKDSTKPRFDRSVFNFETMAGVFLMAIGINNRFMSIGYVAVGTLFILPWFVKKAGKYFKKGMLYSFVILIFLNLVALALGGFNISMGWR